jgi:hypothetical protein
MFCNYILTVEALDWNPFSDKDGLASLHLKVYILKRPSFFQEIKLKVQTNDLGHFIPRSVTNKLFMSNEKNYFR